MTDTFIQKTGSNVKERNSLSLTAYFRDSSNAAATPTTVDYRIDDITTGTKITDWTSITPGTSVSITVKAAENRIIGQCNARERRQIVVSADRGTTTETRDVHEWNVENIGAFEE